MPQPHEMPREWDGKIDRFFLISQMMTLKNEIQLQSDKNKDRPKLQNKSDAYKGNQDQRKPESEQKPKIVPTQTFTLPKVPEDPKPPKFETNPKLKLPSRKPKEQESEYVLKPHAQKEAAPAPKGLDVMALESQLTAKKPIDIADLEKGLYPEKKLTESKPTPQAIDVENLEKGLKTKPLSVDVEDLEKNLLTPKQSQPTDLEEIEAQMKIGNKK